LKRGEHRDAVRNDCGKYNHRGVSAQKGTDDWAPQAFGQRGHYFRIVAGRSLDSSEMINRLRLGCGRRSVGSITLS
jgi:hypothetical protein